MKIEAVRDYYIANGKALKIADVEEFQNIEGPLIYEVNRVVDGIVLFEEGHIERLKSSLEMMGHTMQFSESEISSMMAELIRINGAENQNIKLVYGNLSKEEHKLIMYFVESHYPDGTVYERGIKTILFESERDNPNAKVVNQSLRDRINEKISDELAFEALLVDENGNITEGSRSNFFYIMDGKLYTPPAEKVLLGITRREVIAAAKEAGIDLSERPLSAGEIEKLDGAFITGTSIDALPIGSIGDMELRTLDCSIVETIMDGYRNRVSDYIEKKKA